MKPFLEAVYQLHRAAIKPQAARAVAIGFDDSGPPTVIESDTVQKIGNVHDFVSEMVIGTWIAFKGGDEVTVTLQPVKSGAPVGRLRSVVLPNGQTLGSGGRGGPPPPPPPADK